MEIDSYEVQAAREESGSPGGRMKSCLSTMLIAALCAGPAAAATPDFDHGAPAPSSVIAAARQAPAPVIKEGREVSSTAKPRASATDAMGGVATSLRIVETRVEGDKTTPGKETICYKADGSTKCFDDKTREEAPVPFRLEDFDLKATMQEALALAAGGEFHVAHNYTTRNGSQCFQCWGVKEQYGCRWVTRSRTGSGSSGCTVGSSGVNCSDQDGGSVTQDWVCEGEREVGHQCEETACR